MQVESDLAAEYGTQFALGLGGELEELIDPIKAQLRIDVPRRAKAGDLVVSAPSVGDHHGTHHWAPEGKAESAISQVRFDRFVDALRRSPSIERVMRKGSQVVLTLSPCALFNLICDTVLTQKDAFGTAGGETGHTWMVYYGNPNLNKALHIGHMRSLCIGETIARMLESVGANVIRGSIESDCGIHIAKTIIGRDHLASPEERFHPRSDYAANQYYQLFERHTARADSQLSAAEQAGEMTLKWIEGDPDTREAFSSLTTDVAGGHAQTLRLVGVQFDRRFLESAAIARVPEIIALGMRLRVFRKREDGAIVVDQGHVRREPVLVRANGIPTHLAVIVAHNAIVADEFALHGTVGIEGSEFGDFLSVLTRVIGLLGYQATGDSLLVNYGMVTSNNQKISSSKSRDFIIDDVVEASGTAIESQLAESRYSTCLLQDKGAAIRLATANLKFLLLGTNIYRNVAYDTAAMKRMSGRCGTALLLCNTRLSELSHGYVDAPLEDVTLTDRQRVLLAHMYRFPFVLHAAIRQVEPHRLAQGAYDLIRCANAGIGEATSKSCERSTHLTKLWAACSVVLHRYLECLNIVH